MTHSIELRREDGSKVEIQTRLVWSINGAPVWKEDVCVTLPGKRKPTLVESEYRDAGPWRRLDEKGRREYARQVHLKYATEEELLRGKLELWEKKTNA